MVVPLTETAALVVESRQKLGHYDLRLRKEGVLVYRVDTSRRTGEGPIVVGGDPAHDVFSLLRPGQRVKWQGYSVTLKEVTPEGDHLVEISAID